MLSFNLIVKNEEHCLEECLQSIKPIADEIIIVDTGSTDATVEISKKFTDKIFEFVWINDFSAARNLAKSKTSGDWIFLIDADEVLNFEEYPLILNALKNSNVEAYICITKNFDFNVNAVNWHKNKTAADFRLCKSAGGWFPSEKIRLFRNRTDYRFYGRIHEMLDEKLLSNKIADADFFIYHYGYLYSKLDNKKYSKKLEHYEKLNELKYLEQRDIKSCYELAKQKRVMNKFAESEKLYLECIKKKYRIADCYNDLSALHLAQNNFEQAEWALKKILEIDPENISALNNYASLLYKKKEYDLAIEKLRKIINKKQDHINAYYNLAVIYQELRDYINAEQCYLRILKENEFDANALNNIIILYFDKKEYGKALDYLNKLEKINPSHTTVLKYKDVLLKKTQKIENSEDEKLYNEALTQFHNKNYKGALLNFRKSLNLNNALIETHKYIAKCYKELGDLKKYELEIMRYKQMLARQ